MHTVLHLRLRRLRNPAKYQISVKQRAYRMLALFYTYLAPVAHLIVRKAFPGTFAREILEMRARGRRCLGRAVSFIAVIAAIISTVASGQNATFRVVELGAERLP